MEWKYFVKIIRTQDIISDIIAIILSSYLLDLEKCNVSKIEFLPDFII